jgi:hypothetical protein
VWALVIAGFVLSGRALMWLWLPLDAAYTCVARTPRRRAVRRCPHRALLKPAALGVPMATAVPLAGANFKCSTCGSKQVLTYPESNRDVRKGRTR